MTEEQKKKMADGRRRAMEARAAAGPTLEHVEQAIPAGHIRDEAVRALRDEAVEHNEELANATGAHAIDPAKLDVKNVDNEIAAHWNPERGDIPFSHPQQGFQYAWVTHEDPHGTQARTSIRAMHSHMRRVGWHPVEGDMIEGKEFVGKDCAAATTHRGMADTELWRIRREDWQRVLDFNERKRQKDQSIEQNFRDRANASGIGHALDDNMLARAYGQDRMRPVAFSAAFSTEQIRNGTGPLKPGFDVRGRQ